MQPFSRISVDSVLAWLQGTVQADGGLYKHATRRGVPTAKEVEAHGLMEALRWTLTMQRGLVIIETDSMVVCQALEGRSRDDTEFGRTVRGCSWLLSHQLLCKVTFVRRECNKVADAIAKWCIYLTNPTLREASPD
ncbi:hypothetical protein LINPERPRIM_LOCUS14518 [Linum perenne]